MLGALNAQWRELVATTPGVPPAWVGTHPCLAAMPDLAALLDEVREGADPSLQALVALAQQGDELAARTVLQGMLGRLVQMAARDRGAVIDDYVAVFWCVLARHPLARRPVRIAANLALDTLKAVHRERPATRDIVVVPLAPDDLLPLLERAARHAATGLRDGPAPGAAEVIAAGQRLRLIDETAGRLLRLVYLDGLSGVETAARSASTPGSVRVRCHRAVKRLAEHADELIEVA